MEEFRLARISLNQIEILHIESCPVVFLVSVIEQQMRLEKCEFYGLLIKSHRLMRMTS